MMSALQQIKESRESFRNGKLLYTLGEYKESFSQFQRAVKLQELVFGKYHKETIRSYLEQGKAALLLSYSLENAQMTTVALQSFQRATRMANVSFSKALNKALWKEIETSWYEVHPQSSLVESLSKIFAAEDLGDKAIKKHQFVKAIEYYREALSLQDTLVGKDSLDGADIRYKLGSALIKTSANPQAQQTLQLAYNCYVKHVGRNHPATLGCASKFDSVKISAF